MLISKTVMVRWNSFTTNWYLEKGYPKIKQGEYFECKVEDLPPGSTAKVLVECDYKTEGCKGIHEKPYRQYTEDKENGLGNCCTNKKCGAAKTKEVLLNTIGVDNIQKLDEYKIKSRERQLRPFSLIVDCASKKDLILLTTEQEYKSIKDNNRKSRVSFICPKHIEIGEQSTSVEVFLKNKGCCLYGKGELCGGLNKLDGDFVFNSFVEKGVIPKFKPKDYIDNQTPLPFLCPDHLEKGIQYKPYANLSIHKHKCYYCGKEATAEQLRHEELVIFDYFKDRGLLVTDGQTYKDVNSHIKFECSNHLGIIQEVTYHSLTNTKQPCELCRAEESLNKLNRRLRSSISAWRKRSELNCNKRCIFTGDKKYEVHHLKPFGEIIKETLREFNYEIKEKYTAEEFINIKNRVIELHKEYPLGVCISNKIHTLFHQLYTKEFSIDDWYEFEKRYKLGEFEKLLEEAS
jgi:hypothetical protein